MQGRSARPLLTGKPAPADWPDAAYYRYWMHMAHHEVPAHYGIRTPDITPFPFGSTSITFFFFLSVSLFYFFIFLF